MNKFKQLYKNPRIIFLAVCILIALIIIHPNPFASGAAIQSVSPNSDAMSAGIIAPDSSISPMSREVIQQVNGEVISDSDEYYDAINQLQLDQSFEITTNQDTYQLVNSGDTGVTVYDAPTTNLRKGLDLQGGTRVLLEPEYDLNNEEVDLVQDILQERLNVYGLSDIIIREATDLSGNQFILIEIAGANENEVQELLAKQGKFEAKIGEAVVFTGGNDLTYVCKTTTCSGLYATGCYELEDEWTCRFHFSISLSGAAAKKQAAATENLEIITENGSSQLSENLTLYLDDVLVDELSIASSLKGMAVTDISISGSGVGENKQSAMDNTLDNMRELQTVMQTGSLPVKMEIVKIDSLSPLMGEQFAKNALEVALLALLTVAMIVFIRYRKLSIALPMVFSMLFEVILILGVAALIRWNLDLVAIAGIIVAVGTGVDDLIVFSDESFSLKNINKGWEVNRKNAFFIIMAAYFTTVVAMLPLLFAGAGLLRGFAITTIIGITAGVFIVRPAFAAALKILLGKEV